MRPLTDEEAQMRDEDRADRYADMEERREHFLDQPIKVNARRASKNNERIIVAVTVRTERPWAEVRAMVLGAAIREGVLETQIATIPCEDGGCRIIVQFVDFLGPVELMHLYWEVIFADLGFEIVSEVHSQVVNVDWLGMGHNGEVTK